MEEIVDFLELQAWRTQPVGLLPYGVQKRVELGRALAMEPKLLLLDEPVAGMNLEETEDTARYILDIRDELDVSIVMVEHDMGLVMDLADRVMVIDFGIPITTGTPEEAQRHPDVVRAYLGEEVGIVTSPVTRIREHARQMPQSVALRDKDMGIWREWTWATYWEDIELAGHALLALGVAPGDRVAIHSENRPEWLIADMGALAVRAASVGIYPTSPGEEVGYLLGDSGARILVAEDQEQVDKALSVLAECPDLERIVYLEPRGIQHRYDHEKLLSWQAFLDLGREHREQHPDALTECSPDSSRTTSPR